MRNIIFTLCCLLFAACAVPTANQAPVLQTLTPFAPAGRYIIAVLPFEFKASAGQQKYGDIGARLMDKAVVELFKTKRFRVVERSRINAVLDEIKLSQSGIVAGDMADQIGRQVGAEMVMIGSITSIRQIKSKETVGIAYKNTRGFEVNMSGRLVDIGKGELVAVGQSAAREQQTVKVAMGAQSGSIDPDETLLDKALQKALVGLVNNLAANITPKLAS